MHERRKSCRMEVRLPFWVVLTPGNLQDVLPAEMENISVNGTLFRTREKLLPSTRVRMILSLHMGRAHKDRLLVVGAGNVLRSAQDLRGNDYVTAVSVDRYYLLEPGSVIPRPLESLFAI